MEELTASNFKCNILIMGKSGSGKSSFCNYLFNDPNLFNTGKGKPITTWDENFQSEKFEVNGVPVEIFDTVGIEVTNYERWNRELQDFLEKHSTNQKDLGKWLHSVFYVINAAADRVEEVEKNIIKNLTSEHSLPLQIILTNCDNATPSQISHTKKVLDTVDSNLKIHEVNSVTQRFRTGVKEAFGRENVLETFLNQSYEFIGEKIAAKSILMMEELLKEGRHELLAAIDSMNLSIFNLYEFDTMFDEAEKDLDKKFDEMLEKYTYFDEYLTFMESFNIDFEGIDKFALIDEWLEKGLNDFRSDLMYKLEKSLEDLEDGNFFEKVGAVFTLLKNVLTLKSTIKTVINEVFDNIELDFFKLKKQLLV